MSEKTCRKCGHTVAFGGMEPQSCPECGAVYSKVEAALRGEEPARTRAAVERGPSSRFPVASRGPGADAHAFVQRMRDESLYPFWRKLVGMVTVLGYIVAGLVLVSALVVMFKGSVGAGFGGVVAAVVIAFMARVAKEMWLMLADLSDASVRLAARAESDA